MMRARLLSMAAVPAIAVAAGCGGGSGDGGPGPEEPVLTSIAVTPADTTLFTVSPGNSVTLSVVPRDQNGETMTNLGPPGFSSQDEAVAAVAVDGTVSAAGVGSTQITASLTAEGVTETGTASVTVEVAPATASVTTPTFAYQPMAVDVSAGGTVTWTFGAIHHDVTFTSAGAPANVPLLENTSASRTFPDNGVFLYTCSIHPGMGGLVRVH